MGKSYLELNGKRYDPNTGELIDALTLSQASPAHGDSHPEQKPALKQSAITAKPAAPRKQHQPASHTQAHPQQKSHTLSRKSVKKPSITQKPVIKASFSADSKLEKRPASGLIKKPSAGISKERQQRAHLSTKSSRVTKFTNNARSTYVKTSAAHAAAGKTFDIAPPPKRPVQSAVAPAVSLASPPQDEYTRLVEKHHKTSEHRYLESPKLEKRKGRLKSRTRRALSFGATGLAILLVAGFALWQNKNNIQLQLADAKAGISASLPAEVPSGYSVAGFSYQPGLVAINYASEQDSHSFKLVQKVSGYATNASLLQLVGDSNGKNAQVYSVGGQKIYVNNSGNHSSAAWLGGGILHMITGNASLSRDQIVKLANSI